MSEIDLLRKIEKLEQRLDALVANGESGDLSRLRLGGYTNMALRMNRISLGNLGTALLPSAAGDGASSLVFVFIVDISNGGYAIYGLNGTAHSVVELSDPSGVYTPTAGTASSSNIYWSAGNSRYEIENRRGASADYRILLFGAA